jgi:hypothetical protein
VALQGTLDTFALADVLRLLASTKKTGRLRVSGDRGSGSVWVEDGDVVATELQITGQPTETPAITLYHLLRFGHGSFTFEAGATSATSGHALAIEPLLGEAEQLLAEWRSIEAVVPSLGAWMTLRPDLAGNDVVIDAARWRTIAAVAGGTTAGAVGDALGLGELGVLRALKELVELGLLEVGEAPAGFGTRDPNPFPADMPQRARPTTRDESPLPPSLSEMRSGLATVGLSDEALHAETQHGEAQHAETQHAGAPSSGVDEMPAPPMLSVPPAPEDTHESAPPAAPPAPSLPAPSAEDAAEIARQLANLSPRAAKAVAAAAKAATDEEREAALAAIEAEDETVNRGLLLRFLGSVDS